MANITKLTYPYFTDGVTALNAANLNPLVAKMNEMIDKLNGDTPATVATPVITISGTSATITCATAGATIYYTTNGNTPTSSSTQYVGAIALTQACTIKAIAIKDGVSSSVASQSYSPSGTVTAPTIYIRDLAIIMDAESGATIYYTLDGSTPTSSSTQYTGAFTNASNCTVKAIAVKNGSSSSVASASFTAPQTSELQEPTIVIEGNKATVLSNGVGSIRYDIQGSDTFVAYTEPITLNDSCVVRARCMSGQNTSTTVSVVYRGTDSIVVSQNYETIFDNSRIMRTSSSSTALVVNTSTSTVFLRFYAITQGRKYLFSHKCLTASYAYWGYSNEKPQTIAAETSLQGKLPDGLPTPGSGTDTEIFDPTAENYSYIVTCSGSATAAVTFGEILK